MATVERGYYDAQMVQLARDYLGDGLYSGEEYIFYRTGDFQCTLIVGDIDFDSMTYEHCKDIRIGRQTGMANDGFYYCRLQTSNSAGTVQNPDNVLVYGSADDMPHLVERSGLNVQAGVLLGVCCLVLLLLCLRIFDNVQRR